MCKFLQARKFAVSPDVVENAQRLVSLKFGIFDADEHSLDYGDLCLHYIKCLQPVLADFFPPGSFLTQVLPSDDEIEIMAQRVNTHIEHIGDKTFTLSERTVMHCLMQTIMHEHQTDDCVGVWRSAAALCC